MAKLLNKLKLFSYLRCYRNVLSRKLRTYLFKHIGNYVIICFSSPGVKFYKFIPRASSDAIKSDSGFVSDAIVNVLMNNS